MGSETIAFDIWLLLLCVNAGILIVDATFDTPLLTPFDQTVVTGFSTGVPANIANYTADLTSGQADNSSLGGAPATLNPFDTIFFPLALLWSFIQFVTGGFVFQVIGLFGFPPMFVFALQGIIGILFARSIVYWIWGR